MGVSLPPLGSGLTLSQQRRKGTESPDPTCIGTAELARAKAHTAGVEVQVNMAQRPTNYRIHQSRENTK